LKIDFGFDMKNMNFTLKKHDLGQIGPKNYIGPQFRDSYFEELDEVRIFYSYTFSIKMHF